MCIFQVSLALKFCMHGDNCHVAKTAANKSRRVWVCVGVCVCVCPQLSLNDVAQLFLLRFGEGPGSPPSSLLTPQKSISFTSFPTVRHKLFCVLLTRLQLVEI